MFSLDLVKGEVEIDGKKHKFDKDNCVVVEKNGNIKILCGEELKKENLIY